MHAAERASNPPAPEIVVPIQVAFDGNGLRGLKLNDENYLIPNETQFSVRRIEFQKPDGARFLMTRQRRNCFHFLPAICHLSAQCYAAPRKTPCKN